MWNWPQVSGKSRLNLCFAVCSRHMNFKERNIFEIWHLRPRSFWGNMKNIIVFYTISSHWERAAYPTWFIPWLLMPWFISSPGHQQGVVLNWFSTNTLQWRHNGWDGFSNHQPRDYLLNRLSRRRSQKTSKLRVTGLRAGNSPGIGEFPAQKASNAKNVSIWWRHHDPASTPEGLITC